MNHSFSHLVTPFLPHLRLGIGAGLLVLGGASGCDTSDELVDDRQLTLSDDDELDDLDDAEIDALATEADDVDDDDDHPAAAAPTRPLSDYLDLLPPEAIPDEVTDEDLDRHVEEFSFEQVIDSDGNGIIDSYDANVPVDDPQTIGEMACATASLADPDDGAVVALTDPGNCGSVNDGSISPNTSYDAPGCPHQYITEVTGTYQEPLSFYWAWRGATLDATTCSLAHANLSAYGAYLTFPLGIAWTKIGTTSVHGVWVDGPLFDYCSFALDQGSSALPSLGNHFYLKVRTAVQATGFIFKQRVEGGVHHGPGPC